MNKIIGYKLGMGIIFFILTAKCFFSDADIQSINSFYVTLLGIICGLIGTYYFNGAFENE